MKRGRNLAIFAPSRSALPAPATRKLPLNILVINWQDWTHPLSGGAEKHLHEIFRRIVQAGHRVTLFCCEYEGAPREESIDGISIIRRGRRQTFNLSLPYHYFRSLHAKEFDVVVDNLNKIPFYTPLFVREPLIGISHHFFGRSIYKEVGLLSGSYVYATESLIAPVYKRTDFLTVSGSTVSEMTARGFDPSRIALAMNSIDPTQYGQDESVRSVKPLISYIGRLKRYKSVDHLIRAFALVRREVPEAELHIVGRGDDITRLERIRDSLQLAQSVTFFGHVSDEDKLKHLRQPWVIANPSVKEGWGIVNLEANACATATVSANSPGLRDSVIDGKTGLLYEYGNIEDLADKLLRLLKSEELRKAYGQNGLEFAASLKWEDAAKQVIEVLERNVDRGLTANRSKPNAARTISL